MSHLVKGLAGVAGCSGVCGGYFLINHLRGTEDNRPTVATLITNSGRTLLDSSSDQWVARGSEYVKAQGNPLGIVGYDEKSKTENVAPQEFKDACLTKVNEKVSGEEDKLFKDLAKYCIRMTSISDLLASSDRVTLGSDSGDNSGGLTAWGLYVNNSEENKGGIDNWSVEKAKKTVSEALKTKCETKKTEKAYGIKDIEFKNYIDGCTKDKSSSV